MADEATVPPAGTPPDAAPTPTPLPPAADAAAAQPAAPAAPPQGDQGTPPPGMCFIKSPFRKSNEDWAAGIEAAGDSALKEHAHVMIPIPQATQDQTEEHRQQMAQEEAAAAAEVGKRTTGEAESLVVEEEPSQKRQRRGQNKGKARKAHNLHAVKGEKPTWEGEKNFMPHGFQRGMRKNVAQWKKRKDWVCALCSNKNKGQYQSFTCMKCNAMITEEVDLQTLPRMPRGAAIAASVAPAVPASEGVDPRTEDPPAALEPAAAGWFNPREKKRLDWKDKAYLSPLTTVGNLPFRRICTTFGADITCSEMACAFNLNNFQSSEWSLLRKHESEKNFGLQIAASSPAEGAMLGKILAELPEFDYQFVDINCGCPVDCICNKGMGSSLLESRNRHRLRGILAGLHYQPQPVTIKVRIGSDERNPTLHDWIGDIRDWGAEAITIHGRSKRQRYSKLADWDYIQKCTDLSPVPVVGNGDLLDYTSWNEHLQSGVQGIMTGRGALIKPWLFTEIKEQRHWDISATERLDLLREFTRQGLAHWGADLRGRATTRRFLCEWLSFLCRYVPPPLLEVLPQKHNERPQAYFGRSDLETLMGSDRSSARDAVITFTTRAARKNAITFLPGRNLGGHPMAFLDSYSKKRIKKQQSQQAQQAQQAQLPPGHQQPHQQVHPGHQAVHQQVHPGHQQGFGKAKVVGHVPVVHAMPPPVAAAMPPLVAAGRQAGDVSHGLRQAMTMGMMNTRSNPY